MHNKHTQVTNEIVKSNLPLNVIKLFVNKLTLAAPIPDKERKLT